MLLVNIEPVTVRWIKLNKITDWAYQKLTKQEYKFSLLEFILNGTYKLHDVKHHPLVSFNFHTLLSIVEWAKRQANLAKNCILSPTCIPLDRNWARLKNNLSLQTGRCWIISARLKNKYISRSFAHCGCLKLVFQHF